MFGKCKNTLLKNKWMKKEIKIKNRKYLELNDNILHIKICKIQLQATFRSITIKTCNRRRKLKINRLITKLKMLYKVQSKSKENMQKEITKKGPGINKVEKM